MFLAFSFPFIWSHEEKDNAEYIKKTASQRGEEGEGDPRWRKERGKDLKAK